MKIPVIVRMGTAAAATANNKMLKLGEWGFTTDTFVLKMGRGLAWNDTPGILDAITNALAGKADTNHNHAGVYQPVGDYATNAALNSGLSSKLDIQTPATTGAALTFLADRVYGSETTPEAGNITADVTGAKLGVTNLIIHNAPSAPTFDSKFYKLSGSGDYKVAVKNYIYCQYLSPTRIVYSINQ